MANNNQYYDDNNPKITDILFRPGKAPQSRELNASQSATKRQISAIGDHLFKEGAAVIGGSIKTLEAKTLIVDSTYAGETLVAENFIGKEIVELDASGTPTGARGLVIAVSAEDEEDPYCLHFSDLNSNVSIGTGSSVRTTDSFYANIREFEQPVRPCSYARIIEGTYYFDKTFVLVDTQIDVFSKFDTSFSGYVGIEFTKDVITEFDDPTLYDPARGFANYNGDGAHRSVYRSVLTHYTYNDERPSNFVALMEFREGSLKSDTSVTTQYSELAETFERRTNDESGDYVVNFFKADLVDQISVPVKKLSPSASSSLVLQVQTAIPHGYSVNDKVRIPDDSAYAGDFVVREIISSTIFTVDLRSNSSVVESNKTIYRTEYFGLRISSGKAYVKGREIWIPSSTTIEIPKARSTATKQNSSISIGYGNYVVADSISGMFNVSAKPAVAIRSASDDILGNARVHAIVKDGTKYRIYLLGVSVVTGKDISLARKITVAGGLGGVDVIASFASFSLRSSDTKALFQEISGFKVSTLRPDGIDVLSYNTQKTMSAVVTSSNAVFSLVGTDTFLGARGVNIADSTTWKSEYLLMNSTGAAVTPTSAIISANGKTLTVATAATGTVQLVAPVTVQPEARKKTKKTKTYNVTTITASNRKYTFDVVDAFKVKVTSAGTDVTSRFLFDSGMRDDVYDFGSITLGAGTSVPAAPLTVTVEYFEHSGSGYFSVDSYAGIDYAEIPKYTSSNGVEYDLSNVIDFRYTMTGSGIAAGSMIPLPESFSVIDFKYFLPRKDIVVLSKNGNFSVTSGIPSLDPIYPAETDNEMLMFKVDIGAYTADYKEDVFVHRNQIRRYTMKDIGKLDQRITRVEYETALSSLESKAKTSDVVDENGLSRYKTGFLVDNFSGHGVGDAFNSDYLCAIDRENGILRPAFKEQTYGFELDTLNGFQRVGNEEFGYFLTLPYTTETISENLICSKAVSVTPYLVTKRFGSVNLNPPSDYWKSTTSLPVRNVDMTSEANGSSINLGTVWNESQLTWAGQLVGTRGGGLVETGTQTSVSFSTETQSLGKYVVDVSVSYFMREVHIWFNGHAMRPNTDLHVFVDETNINGMVTERGIAPRSEGAVRTDSLGNFSGKIVIPDGRFRTGERTITFSDEPNNVTANATTEAKFVFVASGLNVTNQETTISTSVPRYTETVVTRPVQIAQEQSSTIRDSNNGSQGSADPFAQSIWVSPELYPNGAFFCEIDLYFKRKPEDSSYPLKFHLRPTEAGHPSSTDIMAFSEIVVPHSEVKIPSNTNSLASVLAAKTTIKMPVPVYVEAGKFFNFVLLSDSPDYEAYASEMGERIIGTDVRIYNQPTLGSSYRSQNQSAWTAFQNEDIMHSAKIAVFPVGSETSFRIKNKKIDEDFRYNYIDFRPQLLEFETSKMTYSLSARDSTTSVSSPISITRDTKNVLGSEKICRENTTDVLITGSTVNSDKYTAPFYEVSKCFAMLTQNVINNYGLVRRNFIIGSFGTNYSAGTTITVNSSTGSGAVIEPIIESGMITDLKVVRQGSGYSSIDSITISDSTGSGASIAFAGFETDPFGGNADARYLTKVVTLNADYEADRADVMIDLSVPSGANYEVFVRSRNSSDAEPITSKSWRKVTKNNLKTTAGQSFIETKFEIDLSYTSGGVTYAFSNELQVKLVPLSTDTSIVPLAKNFILITTI
ncbi:virulence-associated VriC protein [Agrobacterium phage Atu_ph04]|uniref:Virulence-associated VriC protein n=1 Tax=Agrobacterium phage Atu_ph04 TaxID=2024263 RepID=A0A223W0T0_9CAUD|nr:virulence-associated VriC protein [Agrobacterium phage Atu_ph04]ASV44688.1 virulence-associated VriC protein [Agrobacterium phage Atu_ph04]